jgi:hypothetical protein
MEVDGNGGNLENRDCLTFVPVEASLAPWTAVEMPANAVTHAMRRCASLADWGMENAGARARLQAARRQKAEGGEGR